MTKSRYGKSISDFEVFEKIGSGGFADVFKARCLLSVEDTYVAIKRISKKHVAERKCQDRIVNEIDFHSHLPRSPYCVQYYTSFEDEKYWYIVLELCAGGSLEEYIKRKHRVSEEEAAKLIKQVIEGVIHLHDNFIIHRDLSLKNLLLTDNYEVKIADFGFAVKLNHDEKKYTVLGTANFMSPEVVNHESYDFKADCWSVGCVLYALLYGAPPFHNKKREYIMRNVVQSDPVFPGIASSEAKELLLDMLNKDQRERIGLKDALKYAFFQKYEKSYKKYQISNQRSGDSGMSSLRNSDLKNNSKCFQKARTYEYKSNSNESHKERKTRSTKNIPSERYHSDNIRSHEERKNISANNVSAERYHNNNINTRFVNQHDTIVILEKQMPKYSPSELRNSEHSPALVNQMKTKLQTLPPRCITPDNLQNHNVKQPLYSHDQYSIPVSSCIHKLGCCYSQCNRNDIQQSFQNCTYENKNLSDMRNLAVEKSIKDILTPLNTARISSRRKEINDINNTISILSDGQVCLECWKLIKSNKYVLQAYYISQDGSEITVFKPKRKILYNSDKPPSLSHKEQEVLAYNLTNLPRKHRKNYKTAKNFVDRVRSITPKVTMYGKEAKCIMMENSPDPDFEMKFYDGYEIREVAHKITIKDKKGCIVIRDSNIQHMLDEFTRMKEDCKMAEECIEKYLKSNFPVFFGKKPNLQKWNQNSNKENVIPPHLPSSMLNETVSSMKPCGRDVIISIDSSPYQNFSQRSISTLQSTMISSKEIPELNNVKVMNGWIIAEYKDGIQMCIFKQDHTVVFKNIHTQTCFPSDQNPHLMSRYHKDWHHIQKVSELFC